MESKGEMSRCYIKTSRRTVCRKNILFHWETIQYVHTAYPSGLSDSRLSQLLNYITTLCKLTDTHVLSGLVDFPSSHIKKQSCLCLQFHSFTPQKCVPVGFSFQPNYNILIFNTCSFLYPYESHDFIFSRKLSFNSCGGSMGMSMNSLPKTGKLYKQKFYIMDSLHLHWSLLGSQK